MKPRHSPQYSRRSSPQRFRFETLESRRLLTGDDATAASVGVMINEIMYHQAGDDVRQEYIELYNAADSTIDLTDYQFDSGVDFTFPSVAMSPNSYLVVAANVSVFQDRYPDVTNVVGGWNGRLANRGEGITLVDTQGQVVDRVRYADEGDWATRVLGPIDQGHRGWRWDAPHDGDGYSLELRNPELSNAHGHNWGASISMGGTPGRENSIMSSDIAPALFDLAHDPIIPTSQTHVRVSLGVADEATDSVTAALHFRMDGQASFQVTTMAWDAVSERFVAQIPPQPNASIVEYFVVASDGGGQSRQYPMFETDDPARTANRLYQVLDDAPSPDDWDPASQPFTYLIMRSQERAILADIGDGPLAEAESNAQMNGTYLRVDGNSIDVRHNVGIRNRGGASRVGPPNNYRVNFSHDTPVDGETTLNINAMFAHVEAIGSSIFRLAGLPAAEVLPIQVRVNGQDLADPLGQMHGSYAESENITGKFPDRYFPDDNRGNLYRVVEVNREFGALGYAGNDPAAYQENFSKRTNEEQADWSDIIDLLDVLNNAPEADFLSEVHRVLDVDQWLRYLALDSLLGNSETGLNAGRADKFWLYRGTQDTRFRIIPHDLDTILDVGRNARPNRSVFSDYVEVQGLRRFLTHDEIVPRYYQAFEDLMRDVFRPDVLFPMFDRLIGYVPDFELENMKQFVVDRIASVEAQLPREFAISTDLPVVDGYPRTTLPAAELVGIANSLDTASVRVQGQLAQWSRATREWSVPITGDGEQQTLVSLGSEWRYFDQGAASGSWSGSAFNDTAWQRGPAPLGYGEGDEATELSFGSSPFNKHITSYFRHQFTIDDASEVLDLTLRLIRDDGAVVYLNGQEIVRSNLPDGPIEFGTLASSWVGGGAEGQALSFPIDPNLLTDGVNTLAVEVHQVDSVDSDLRFDLSLAASVGDVSGGVPLHPGINRVKVVAYKEPGGQGEVVDEGFLDVWYDGSQVLDPAACDGLTAYGTPASSIVQAGTFTQDTVFGPCGPAYRITGPIVVPDGVTVTVLPGTTLFFDENAGMVFQGGQLLAEGTEFAPIRFTRSPDVSTWWDGLQFIDSTADNRVAHAVIEHATTAEGMIGLRGAKLDVSDTTFDHADLFRIFTVDSSLTIRDSVFTDIFQPGEPPLTDNSSEHIKGSGILAGGQLILENNYFGTTTGHNDSVDFDGAMLPGPIPIIRGNYFAGSGDDALDLEADSFIVDNTFVDVRKDIFNTSTGDANAISAGAGRTYYAYRNRFYDVDHAVQVKDEAFLEFAHNTVDTVHISPIYFDLPDRTPGRGANVTHSIFSNTPVTIGAADQAQVLEVHNSLVTQDALAFGTGNRVADAKLKQPDADDFSLLPGSPAIGQAFAMQDLGAEVSAGPWLAGLPGSVTSISNATITVAGPGIEAYRYRINDSVWSDVRSVQENVVLSDLTAGLQSLEVQGFEITGAETDVVAKQWTIDPMQSPLFISEVLASNDSILHQGGTPDLIELYNESTQTIDISGMSISDRIDQPRNYVFPPGTTIPAEGFLVVAASDGELGFRLDADGEGVFLFDGLDRGGGLVDAVKFGIQVTDLSISRVLLGNGQEAEWTLSQPTFGQQNQPLATGRIEELRINEWLASSETRFRGDYLELYNRDDVPVSLGGLYLTDDPIADSQKHRIAPLSFIAADGFVVFEPNRSVANGANEVEFGISENGEILALLDSDLRVLDQVYLTDQTIDVSQGRTPDGSIQIDFLALGTPGQPNPAFETTVDELLSYQAAWQFNASGDDLGNQWQVGDVGGGNWQSGPGPFGIVNGELEIPIQTPLAPPRDAGVITHYFRSTFQIDEALLVDNATQFVLNQIVDDGAVVYINGREFLRTGLSDGEITSTTTAIRGIGVPEIEGPFEIPADFLRAGDNKVAVEVHQVSPRNADIAMGLQIEATRTFTSDSYERAIVLQDGLRISEVMYHPSADEAAEFIELTNVSEQTLDLSGVRIDGSLQTTIGRQFLAPGEHAVLVASPIAFRATYGADVRLLGVYSGSLPNSAGEIVLRLPDPLNDRDAPVILSARYDDDWYPSTDGVGRSLEIRSTVGPLRNWTSDFGWRASGLDGGSPGTDGTLPGDFNRDQVVDARDVDLLAAEIAMSGQDARFDLNRDSQVNDDDLDFLFASVLQTRRTDFNLDGEVGFADFLILSANFGRGDANWSDGDADASGDVDFADFLALSAHFSDRT